MSVLDQLDVSEYFNGKMDRGIEKRHEILEVLKSKGCPF